MAVSILLSWQILSKGYTTLRFHYIYVYQQKWTINS